MSNNIINLPVPGAVGVGAAVDTTRLGGQKTVVVGGAFQGSLTVEASHDGVNFAPVASFSGANPGENIAIASCFMRVRLTALTSGTPTVDVAAGASIMLSAAPAVPAGNGAGAAVDIRALFDLKTVFVLGTFTGACEIQVSNDGTTWAPLKSFGQRDQESFITYARFARVVRSNVAVANPGLPIVGICGASSSANPPTGTTSLSGCDESVTINVFVDAILGDDANDGMTAASALQTLQAVYRKFPTVAMAGCTILVNLASDTGAGTPATYAVETLILESYAAVTSRYRYVGPEMVPVVPTSGPSIAVLDAGTPATQVDNTNTPSGTGRRTRLNFVTAAPGWTVDNFQTAFVRITRGGSQVIAECPISKNTADTLIVDNDNVVAAVAAGDTVEIVRPGAIVEGLPANAGVLGIAGKGSVHPNLLSPGDPSAFTRLQLSSPVTGQGLNAGYDRCRFSGLVCFWLAGKPSFANCSSLVAAFLELCRDAVGGTTPSGTFLSTAGRVSLICKGRIQFVGGTANITQNMSVWNSTLPGSFICRGGAVVSAAGTVALQGISTSGAGSVGIKCIQNSVCEVAGGDRTVVTNTSGALRVTELQAVVAYGTGVGAFQEVAGFNGFLCRNNAGTATAPLGDSSYIAVGGKP